MRTNESLIAEAIDRMTEQYDVLTDEADQHDLYGDESSAASAHATAMGVAWCVSLLTELAAKHKQEP